MAGMMVALEGDMVMDGLIIASQMTWKINGIPIACVGDQVTPHGVYPDIHVGATIMEGSPWMSINGKAVATTGSLASCGDPVTAMLQQWMSIPGV
jgi:uncharacterized Zn-binding protein involved in type VI secretion